MTRIKRSWKKAPDSNPRVVKLIDQLLVVPEDELTGALEDVNKEGWQWPRSDLVFWIPVLNRFDALLETVVKGYELRGPGSKKEKDAEGKEVKEDPAVEAKRLGVQMNPFTPRTKRTVLAIIGFCKLLLENCTNRKLFSSYDRANDLLLTSDTDVLLATLRLCIRPAQQCSSQEVEPMTGFGVAHSRLLDLAQSWSVVSRGGQPLDFVPTVVSRGSVKCEPAMDAETSFQFYRKLDAVPPASRSVDGVSDDKGKGKEKETEEGPVAGPSSGSFPVLPVTPVKGKEKEKDKPIKTPAFAPPSHNTVEGLTNIQIPSSQLVSTVRLQDLLADLVEEHGIPSEHRLKLFHRIRLARAIRDPDPVAVRSMAIVRLLALALYMHTTNESTAAVKVFLYEPSLVAHLAELLHPDKGVHGDVQAAALYALEGMARYRTRVQEVTSALGVSVSHGVLMQVIRRMAKELEKSEPYPSPEFIDALFGFLGCLQLSTYAGGLLLHAGIVPVLVDICKNAHSNHISVVTRAVANLDGLMYGFSPAFGLFNTAHGLRVFVDRIQEQVAAAIQGNALHEESTMKPSELLTGLLSHPAAGLLKGIFRAIQRLLSSAGTMDQVRNLTETSMPRTIKSILQHKSVFGYQIYALAINQMSAVIHSEPTSLAILQEQGIPEAFYEAIEHEIEPAFDVVAAIPSALGALCLNEAGLQQLNSRPAISRLFHIITSEKHVRVLKERNCASNLGTALDELIRHQPTLRQVVLDESLLLVRRVKAIGEVWTPPPGKAHYYRLEVMKPRNVTDAEGSGSAVSPVALTTTNDAEMKDSVKAVNDGQPGQEAEKAKEKEKETHSDNMPLQIIEVTCRLFEALSQNISHCEDFMNMSGFDELLQLLSLPCIPYDFSNTTAAEALASTLRAYSEALPEETLTRVLERLAVDMQATKGFGDGAAGPTELSFSNMVNLSSDNATQAQGVFRHLISAHSLILTLTDVCTTFSYSNSRPPAGLLSVLNGVTETKTLLDLGRVQRTTIAQGIALKSMAPAVADEKEKAKSVQEIAAVLAAAEGKAPSSLSITGEEVKIDDSNVRLSEEGRANATALKAIANDLTSALQPLFRALVKLIARRSGGADHDETPKASLETAATLAKICKSNLIWPNSGDLSNDFACTTVSVGYVGQLLIDEGSLSKPLLVATFDEFGGVDALLDLLERYLNQADVLTGPAERDAKQSIQLVHTYGGLKVLLDLLQTLASTSHTQALHKLKVSTSGTFDAPNFIISLRSRILPAFNRIWASSWLKTSPPNIVRTVTQTLLEIIKAEGESAPSVPNPDSTYPALAERSRPTITPDEGRVTTLIDMGFPRSACEAALTRTGNNVSLAVELLLPQSGLIQEARGEGAAAAAARQAQDASADTPGIGPGDNDEPMAEQDESPEQDEPPVPPSSEQPEEKRDGPDATRAREQLDAMRSEIRGSFLEQGLVLAEGYENLVFDLKTAFRIFERMAGSETPFDAIALVLSKIKDQREVCSDAASDQSNVVRWRLLALLTNDPALESFLQKHSDELMSLVKEYLEPQLPTLTANCPRWVASCLLVAESLLLSYGTSTDEASAAEDLKWGEEKQLLYGVIAALQSLPSSGRHETLSSLRLLLLLTQSHATAEQCLQSDWLPTALRNFAYRSETRGSLPYAALLLRHAVEDKASRLDVMRGEIISFLSQPRRRVADSLALTQHFASLAWRDQAVLVEAVTSVCQLLLPDLTTNAYYLHLRDGVVDPPPKPGVKSGDETPSGPTQHQAAAGSATEKGATPATSSAVAHRGAAPSRTVSLLLKEMVTYASQVLAVTEASESANAATSAGPSEPPRDTLGPEGINVSHGDPMPSPTTAEADPAKADDRNVVDFTYLCFLMSWLSELVAAYPECKASLVSLNAQVGVAEKFADRQDVLGLLLTDLVPVGPLTQQATAESQKRNAVASWAIMLLVALCHDPIHTCEVPESIAAARVFVVDGLARALQDALASDERTDLRYGRLHSLADLTFRLLTASPFPQRPTSTEASIQISKLMLERNFAALLSGALAEVDLNFPSVQRLLNNILRPLEHLTKACTKLDRPADRADDKNGFEVRSMSSETSDDVEMAEEQPEDAPDLYRHSALGLYEGELEPGHRDVTPQTSEGEDAFDDEEEYVSEMDDAAIQDLADSDISDASEDEEEGDVTVEASGDEDMTDDDGDEDEDTEDEGTIGEEASEETSSDSDEQEDHEMEADVAAIGFANGTRLTGLASGEGSLIGGDEEEGEMIHWQGAPPPDALSHDAAEVLATNAPPAETAELVDAISMAEQLGGQAEDGFEDDAEDDSEDEDGDAEELAAAGGTLAEPVTDAGDWSWNGVLPFQPGDIVGGTSLLGAPGRGMLHAHDPSLASLFGRPRSTAQPTELTRHPLLTEDITTQTRPSSARFHRRPGHSRMAQMPGWLTSIERLVGPGASEVVESLLIAASGGQGRIRTGIGNGAVVSPIIDPQRGVVIPLDPNGRGNLPPAPAPPSSRLDRQLAERAAGQTLMPVPTLTRWIEEASMFRMDPQVSGRSQRFFAERLQRVSSSIVEALLPEARRVAEEKKAAGEKKAADEKKAEEKRAKKAEKEAKEREKAEEAVEQGASAEGSGANAEGTAGGQDQQRHQPVNTEDGGLVNQGAQAEDVEMRDAEPEAAPADTEVAHAAEAMQGVSVHDDVAEVMNLARQLAASVNGMFDPNERRSASGANDHASLVIPPAAAVAATNDSGAAARPEIQPPPQESGPAANEPEASGSGSGAAASERVTIMVNGAEVDITNTGIDPTFLEALPDDMREEVINQHFRENRVARQEPALAIPSTISADFLDALPPELRAEVLRSEAVAEERAQRREREAASGSRGPSDIDPATFLASLDPSLRGAVLMEQDDGFISTLPANLLAEMDTLRERQSRLRRYPVHGGHMSIQDILAPGSSARATASHVSKKPAVKTDAPQVLDRAGIASLVRLLFFPQPLRRNSLQKVLIHICENTKSRTELVNTLLGLLQDGSGPTGSMEDSFANVSARASRSLPPATPKTPRPRREVVTVLPQPVGESVPNLIAMRSLESLALLVQANDRIPFFFLTEQELGVTLTRKSAKKGKGKAVTYPIVSLLGLLDRACLDRQPNLTEHIMSLLALIARPLVSFAKKADDPVAGPPGAPTPEIPHGGVSADSAASMAATPHAATSGAVEQSTPQSGPAGERKAAKGGTNPEEASAVLQKPPILPEAELRLIVNVLDGDCSSKTFGHTLTFTQYLSSLPDARHVITDELANRARLLGEALLPDLDELLEALKHTLSAPEMPSSTLAKFSPAGARQATLLRILKTSEFLDSHGKDSQKGTTPSDPTAGLVLMSPSASIASLRSETGAEHGRFRRLWAKLSECLTQIQSKDDLAPVATILLPLMEAFLVICKHASITTAKAPRASMSPFDGEDPPSSAASNFFFQFTDKHRKVLNTMVRNNPALMSGSFSILVNNPKVLDFDNKRNYFSQQLHRTRSREAYGTLLLNVRRAYVFEDSFHNLVRRTGDEIKFGKLSVHFYQEEAVDAGGVTREWLTILVKQMLDPNYALFIGSAADSKTYQPNRASYINRDHLSFFTFCGRVIGKALYDGRVVDAYFTLAFYKHLLGIPVGLSDLESVDPDHHRSLKWMLDNDIDGVLDLTFSVEADDFGRTRIVDLKPGGRDIVVTNDNKAEYVQLLVQNRLTDSIKEQITAFKKGFDEIIPSDLINIFSATELQLLLNGLPDINVEDWRANTELHQFTQSDSTVTWFWRAVRSFEQEERAKLLQFATGSSRVPLEGFGALQGAQGPTKFTLVNAHTKNVLPSAHTCFNSLDLPAYDTYEDLRRMLVIAINEGSEGFGFA